MHNQWFVVVNPVSGARKGLKVWKEVKPLMENRSMVFKSSVTQRDKHSTNLIAEAISEGYRNFICIGGDGTLHNMVNGIMKQNLVPTTDVTLLMMSVGTGNDWVRNYGIPKKHNEVLDLITSGKSYIQDVGMVTYHENGSTKDRYFHNFAGVGFDAFVVERTIDLKRIGRMAYTFGLARSLFQYKVQRLKIEIDQYQFDEKMYMVLAGIGRYGGGGMKLTPDAEMNDGLLDVMIAKNFTVPEIIVNAPRLFSGSFVHHQKVDTLRTKSLKIEAEAEPDAVYLEADGELIGRGPFSIILKEKALKVLIP